VTPERFVALPSIAYRLARAAAGDDVAAVSLNSRCEWDYAAGHALVRVLLEEAGRDVTYTSDGISLPSAEAYCGATPTGLFGLSVTAGVCDAEPLERELLVETDKLRRRRRAGDRRHRDTEERNAFDEVVQSIVVATCKRLSHRLNALTIAGTDQS
jgi:hypothetical protein